MRSSAHDPAGRRLGRRPRARGRDHRPAPIRYCRRRSASARPAPPRWRRSASPSPICGPLRTGRRQDVAVDTRQATASLRSGHYMKMDGAAVSTERNTVMGVYPAKNGRWSYLHCNFPNHRAAALSVLGVPEDREAVRKAVAKWDALELEEAIIAAKGAGGMVRTMDEWAKHPQAAAIASLPLHGDRQDRRQRAGKAARRRSAAVRHPRARPDARARRADLRAHARRARRRRAEDHRQRTCRTSATRNTTPATASSPPISICASRRSVEIAARTGARGRRVLARLPAGHARRPRVLARGAGAKLRPGIVFVSLCAFSHVGPWASRRGFDTVVQTVSGITEPPGRAVPRRDAGPAVLSGVGDRLS